MNQLFTLRPLGPGSSTGFRMPSLLAAVFLLSTLPEARAGVLYQTGFEPPVYATGNIQGQDGWNIDGPTSLIQVETTFPQSGTQSLIMRSVGLTFSDRARRPLVFDMAASTDKTLVVSSDAALTSGTRSQWELNTVFGTAGFLGAMRILGTNEITVWNITTEFKTGVFTTDSYNNYELRFDFAAGFMTALLNGTQIITNVPFNNANTNLTFVAAGTMIAPGADAIAIDNFSVSTVPEPATAALSLLALAAMGAARRFRSLRIGRNGHIAP